MKKTALLLCLVLSVNIYAQNRQVQQHLNFTQSLGLILGDSIAKWQEKGEYEKTSEWEYRLKTKSDSIFIEYCKRPNRNLIKGIWWSYEKSSYDPDTEEMVISLRGNKSYVYDYKKRIKLSPQEAQKLALPYGGHYDRSEILKKDGLVLIDNEYLALTTLDIKCHSGHVISFGLGSIDFPKERMSHIILQFDDMGIENKYLKGYRYDVTDNKCLYAYTDAQIDSIDSIENYRVAEIIDSALFVLMRDMNDTILSNPYNLNNYTLWKFKETEAHKAQRIKSYAEDTRTKEGAANLLKDLRKYIMLRTVYAIDSLKHQVYNDLPPKYVEIVLSQNPIYADSINKSYSDYRCHYTPYEYAHDVIYKVEIKSPSCREESKTKYLYLFPSETEFDKFYDRGDSLLNYEIEDRLQKRQIDNYIKSLPDDLENLNLQGEKVSDKQEITNIINPLIKLSENRYYSRAIHILLQRNKKMQKEYQSKGQLFTSEQEFFEAYISPEYKEIIKSKK